jgi:hypothetical protein
VSDATGAGGRFTRTDAPKKRETGRGWYWLLVIPFLGVLFPTVYNSDSPEFIGIPFFWWYQMAWVPITALIMVVLYRATTRKGR